MDSICIWSVICSAGIFASTIQAQDFRDTVGDRLVGRKTLPLVAPAIARPTLMFALFAWTTSLSFLWKLSVTAMIAFHCLVLFVGGRFILLTSVEADRRNFHIYSVSQSPAQYPWSFRLTWYETDLVIGCPSTSGVFSFHCICTSVLNPSADDRHFNHSRDG